MVLRPDVLNAFKTLDIDVDADLVTATKAYKRLALLHHPDRNHGDSGATQRFQQVPLLPRLQVPYVFSHQPRRSVLRGISARDISTIRHGATSQSPRVEPLILTMMIFPWTKMTFTSFTCKDLFYS